MNKNVKDVPSAVKFRLPKYLRILSDFKRMKVERISSSQLSEMLGFTASQVRQDLNHFGGFGQQGYGYSVIGLYNAIRSILGLENNFNVIIVGCGKIGMAFGTHLADHEKGYNLLAGFDLDPQVIGRDLAGATIYSVDKLDAFLKENRVDIAVISTKQDAAQKIADKLCAGGIKGILNFATKDLEVSENVKVENIHITDILQILTYDITHDA